MKKLNTLAVLAALIVQSTFMSSSAHAGIGIVALGSSQGVDQDGTLAGASRIVGLTVAVGGGMGLYLVQTFGGPNLGGWFSVIGAILLDADGNLNQDALSQGIAKQYPFIDNIETIQNMAGAIKAKANAQIRTNKTAIVSLNENEVRELLSNEDLSEEQVGKIVSDLK